MPKTTSSMNFLAAVLCILTSAHVACGQSISDPSNAAWTVQVRDLTTRFLDFYQTAVRENASPDRRWELWTAKYYFAAVPPIAAGQALARKQLDEAWPKYQSALARIETGAHGLTPSPQNKLDEVVALLKPTISGEIQLTTFVGTFHRSAFASGNKDGVWKLRFRWRTLTRTMRLT